MLVPRPWCLCSLSSCGSYRLTCCRAKRHCVSHKTNASSVRRARIHITKCSFRAVESYASPGFLWFFRWGAHNCLAEIDDREVIAFGCSLLPSLSKTWTRNKVNRLTLMCLYCSATFWPLEIGSLRVFFDTTRYECTSGLIGFGIGDEGYATEGEGESLEAGMGLNAEAEVKSESLSIASESSVDFAFSSASGMSEFSEVLSFNFSWSDVAVASLGVAPSSVDDSSLSVEVSLPSITAGTAVSSDPVIRGTPQFDQQIVLVPQLRAITSYSPETPVWTFIVNHPHLSHRICLICWPCLMALISLLIFIYYLDFFQKEKLLTMVRKKEGAVTLIISFGVKLRKLIYSDDFTYDYSYTDDELPEDNDSSDESGYMDDCSDNWWNLRNWSLFWACLTELLFLVDLTDKL